MLKIKINNSTVSILQIYAPTSSATPADRESLQIDEIYKLSWENLIVG